jgi:hypothetical protein
MFGFYRSGAEGPLLSEARLLHGIGWSAVWQCCQTARHFVTFDLYCTAINQRSFLQGRMQFLLSKPSALCEAHWWGGHSFILSVLIAVFCESSFYMKGTSNTEGWIRPALDMGYQRHTKQWRISVWSGVLKEMNMKNITDFWYIVPCNLKERCTCRLHGVM